MTDYVKTTDFAAKDSLPTDDPGKLIKGTEHGVEYDAIASASSTKTNKVSGGTNNNIILMDAAGDLKDSTIGTDGAGTITADLTGDVTGNADTATSSGACTGNSATATKWSNPTTLSLTGDVTGSVVLDGSDTTENMAVSIAASKVNFNNEMQNVTTNYDFTFSDTATQTVAAGVYNYGKPMPGTGSMNGTLKLQHRVDGAWYDKWSIAVTGGAATIPVEQVISNGTDLRHSFTYVSGTKSSITLRGTKIFN